MGAIVASPTFSLPQYIDSGNRKWDYRHASLVLAFHAIIELDSSFQNARGWTVPEFPSLQVIRFNEEDRTLYLDIRSPSHKESVEIMHALKDTTAIDARALVTPVPKDIA
ncbi:hypothetical protein EDB19DRAFT_1910033 [Suillus lakei]|nr:hypothetical protein EDB19DRAFT_1910033 [Suillus lakei]